MRKRIRFIMYPCFGLDYHLMFFFLSSIRNALYTIWGSIEEMTLAEPNGGTQMLRDREKKRVMFRLISVCLLIDFVITSELG